MDEINIQQHTPQVNIDTATRTYHLPIASETTLGGIKVGTNLTIEEDGTLNAEATEYQLPAATASTLGGIKVGAALAISDGVLSVSADQALDTSSANPVRNSVITSNINTLTNTLSGVSDTVTTLSNNYTTLSGTVSDHTTALSTLDGTVTDLGLTVSDHTTAIEGNTSSIGDLTESVTTINSDIDNIEGDIVNLSDGSNILAGKVDTLDASVSDEITYSYLLPVSTWSSGTITLERRGKVGTVNINLEGSLTLTQNTPSSIYTFSVNIPTSDSFGILCSDDGIVVAKISNTGELSIEAIDGGKTITKLQGSITVLYS